jgi:hypothetical protein
LLESHIDLSGWPDKVSMLLINRVSRRFELKSNDANSLMLNPVPFSIFPLPETAFQENYSIIVENCGASLAFISGIGGHLPEASITFDKSHVIQAQDEARRTEQKHNP